MEEKRLNELIKNTEVNRIKALEEARSKLNKDLQSKITDEDIKNIANGKVEDRKEIKELLNMQQKLQEKREDELTKELSNELKISFEDSKKIFPELKRYTTMALSTGVTGVLILMLYDLIQERGIKNEFTNKVENAIKEGNFTDINKAIQELQGKVGKIMAIDKLKDSIKESNTFIELKNNKEIQKDLNNFYDKRINRTLKTISNIKEEVVGNKKTTIKEETTNSKTVESESKDEDEEDEGLEIADALFMQY